MPVDRKQMSDVQRILGEPDLYPPELLSWILKKLSDNPYFQVSNVQLPTPEAAVKIDTPGAPAFAGNWENYAAGWLGARIEKDPFGTVQMHGLVKTVGGPGALPSLIFTLPTGYRPEENIMFSNVCHNGAYAHARVDVASTGTVTYVDPTGAEINFVSLNGVWRAYT